MATFRHAAQILKTNLKYLPLTTPAIPDCYEGDSLSAHIANWVRERYGKRLKMDLALGYSLILIKGDPWLFRFPLIFGKVTVFCDRNLQNTSLFVGHAATTDLQKGKATVNLLRCIDKLPQSLANDLSRVELQEIMDVFQFGNRFLSTLASFHANDELGKSAVTDLTYSARYCLDRQLGQSRWASLQPQRNS
jgi:hypothetical protein